MYDRSIEQVVYVTTNKLYLSLKQCIHDYESMKTKQH